MVIARSFGFRPKVLFKKCYKTFSYDNFQYCDIFIATLGFSVFVFKVGVTNSGHLVGKFLVNLQERTVEIDRSELMSAYEIS